VGIGKRDMGMRMYEQTSKVMMERLCTVKSESNYQPKMEQKRISRY